MGKTAWVTGATGLVGGELMTQLAKDSRYDRIIALVRKPSGADWSHAAKVTQISVNFDSLEDSMPAELIEAGTDDLFCALGTTKKKTPDAKQYYQIDVNYPIQFARLGLLGRAHFFGVVSAHGANPRSFSSYFKMKGDMERGVIEQKYKALALARPGMIKGDRGEFRLLEKTGEIITDLLPGNYRTIAAQDIAASLISAANNKQQGQQILESKAMQGAYQSLGSN